MCGGEKLIRDREFQSAKLECNLSCFRSVEAIKDNTLSRIILANGIFMHSDVCVILDAYYGGELAHMVMTYRNGY